MELTANVEMEFVAFPTLFNDEYILVVVVVFGILFDDEYDFKNNFELVVSSRGKDEELS